MQRRRGRGFEEIVNRGKVPDAAAGHMTDCPGGRPIPCYPEDSMEKQPRARKLQAHLARAVIEVAFIIFLFYSNLLMGEFNGSSGPGKTLAFALHDILTAKNFLIARISAMIGHAVFETLRKKF
jgi:hypothetical protein